MCLLLTGDSRTDVNAVADDGLSALSCVLFGMTKDLSDYDPYCRQDVIEECATVARALLAREGIRRQSPEELSDCKRARAWQEARGGPDPKGDWQRRVIRAFDAEPEMAA